jgi:hypothetical protein
MKTNNKTVPYWLPKEIGDMYSKASDRAQHFIHKLAPSARYVTYNTSNYADGANKNKTNYAYATLILDQLAAEFQLSPIFELKHSEFTSIHYRRDQSTTYWTNYGQLQMTMLPYRSYQDVTAMFLDHDFMIQIDVDRCRPLHIHFSHILSRTYFAGMPKISGEWPNNIDKVRQELKKQMLIKIVEM